ncbi:hypothetical protein HUJ04_011239 [Dendroctonus ponderosae]|nr:hypothetical protein HUJ04_011239 [Dendroctonus ponderosae]KAH1021755.1 hypothetical protein HUJ04_011239 [Dendroctonus ponderosae]
MYAWGSTINGELGLGGIEDEHILTPRLLDWYLANKVVECALGDNHTLFLTNEGQVYSCGNNDYGQLGHDQPRKRPQPVTGLDAYNIVRVACGATHSTALNQWGQVFSWGSDYHGQLGQQLDGDILAWGANNFGQLGIGLFSSSETTPKLVASLRGIPIVFITCGANHTFAISKSGAVYGWGKNTRGQLGVNDTENKMFPTQLRTMRNLRVRYIACGEEFSAFLTLDGGVFTCGAGMYGQLGHGSNSNEILPRQIFTGITDYILNELTPNPPDVESLRVYLILPLYHEFNNTKQYAKLQKPFATQVLRLKQPANKVVGGWWSMMTADYFEKLINIFKNVASHILRNQNIPQGRTVFYDSALVAMLDIMVFLNKLNHNIDGLKVPYDIFHMNELHDYLDVRFDYVLWLSDNDSGKLYLCNYPFLFDAHAKLKLLETDQSLQYKIIFQIFTGITDYILNELTPNPPDVESLRVYLILPLYHEFNNTKQYAKLQKPFATQVLRLKQPANKVVREWWSMMTADYFEKLINIFKNVASHILRNQNIPQGRTVFYDSALVAMLDIMVFLNKLNHNIDGLKVPYDIFHMNELHDYLDVRFDYVLWLSDNDSGKLYLCNYPFLFDAHAKLKLLETDQSLQMQNAMQNAAQQAAFAALFSPTQMVALNQFLVLNVTRDHIIEDTLRELRAVNPSDLKKPLKVNIVFNDYCLNVS